MEKKYFTKLLKAYCNKLHLKYLCDDCKKVLIKFENNTLSKDEYNKIIAYSSYFFKRFHYHTFNRLSKALCDDLFEAHKDWLPKYM